MPTDDQARITAILDFWIGEAGNDPVAAKKQTRRWYQSTPESDTEISSRFGADLAAAERGQLAEWRATADGSLALVILLDQFSRNVFRGTARAFANDDAALEVARAAIDAGQYDDLSIIGKVFLLHPFHHSERLSDHDVCVNGYEALLEMSAPEWQPLLENFLSYAREHRDVVAQFGRFPHRNAVLGRETTEAEQAYLDGGGRRYGQ